MTPEKTRTIADSLATQLFAIRFVLTANTYAYLTPLRIDEIMESVKKEITEGACAWAFKENKGDTRRTEDHRG